eukprot:GHVN01005029.1.p1 GENE.GHVN01005029.1~~GHVN01005029.1.p1  ORF type:complete len:231 (+),score=23.11 GHVN01005029.1:79-771(+)
MASKSKTKEKTQQTQQGQDQLLREMTTRVVDRVVERHPSYMVSLEHVRSQARDRMYRKVTDRQLQALDRSREGRSQAEFERLCECVTAKLAWQVLDEMEKEYTMEDRRCAAAIVGPADGGDPPHPDTTAKNSVSQNGPQPPEGTAQPSNGKWAANDSSSAIVGAADGGDPPHPDTTAKNSAYTSGPVKSSPSQNGPQPPEGTAQPSNGKWAANDSSSGTYSEQHSSKTRR